jgi:hypothetical protein
MSNWAARVNRGHFGVTRPRQGHFLFNVLHLGGHVLDTTWQHHLPCNGGWLLDGQPYGWRWKAAGKAYGIELTPGFPSPFDENK